MLAHRIALSARVGLRMERSAVIAPPVVSRFHRLRGQRIIGVYPKTVVTHNIALMNQRAPCKHRNAAIGRFTRVVPNYRALQNPVVRPAVEDDPVAPVPGNIHGFEQVVVRRFASALHPDSVPAVHGNEAVAYHVVRRPGAHSEADLTPADLRITEIYGHLVSLG